ncbi:MAG: pentapeptide repeat-containing protein, partial [Planctomycetota bacterium]|nr:pentapeptide repeat-containing protein [Planctomycetota bacterium]
GAHLEGADFKGARVYGARLRGAHLEGADLSAATGLTLDQLRSAHIDEATSLPRSVEEHRAEIGA